MAGQEGLFAPQWIDRVSWSDSKVYVDLSRETIKNGPEYHPEALNRKYEETLYDYYKRPKHWDSPIAGLKSASDATRLQGADRRKE